MNKPIRTLSLFCLLLFLALLGRATYLQYYEAESLNARPENRRVIEAAYSAERGAILVGRTPIAESKPSGDRYKFQRTYSQPNMYAPLTGYFSYYSQTGVEHSENAVLSGDDSRLFVTRLVDLLSNATPKGGGGQLTVNAAAQAAAFNGLKNRGPGAEGSVVAIDPSTGAILAMASYPSYDPNQLASHDFKSVAARQKELESAPGTPMVNRAIQTRLFPGSTFKVVTAAAAIESGKYSYDSSVPGGATYQLPQTTGDTGLVDNEGRDCGSGKISFSQAMENSCNTSFAHLAVNIGADQLRKTAEGFGFNQHYLDDLGPQVTSVFPQDLNPPQTGQAGFGQFDVQATPLQMAMVAAGIANGGVVMKPYVVDGVLTPELEPLPRTDPQELSQAISADTADQVTKLMVDTVRDGTAYPAAIPGVDVAGKTGTAQTGTDEPPYAWFISFAPADDPKVAVAVMIQKAPGVERGEIAGGTLGGPIAKAIMEAVIHP
jgi:peptidoglycan glycosyltransferase